MICFPDSPKHMRICTPYVTESVRGVDQSNIIAAIILTANLGFLAFNSLTQLQAGVCLMSTTFAFSSFLLGLYHIRRQNFKHPREDQTQLIRLAPASHSPEAFRLSASLYCLPSVLLIWSIVTFCVSVGLLAYHVIPDSVGWRIFMAIGTILLVLLGATVWFFWGICEPAGLPNGPRLCRDARTSAFRDTRVYTLQNNSGGPRAFA